MNTEKRKIVMLDRDTIGKDINVSFLEKYGELKEYNMGTLEEKKEWVKDAEIIIFNKTVMNEDLLEDANNLKLLCVTATGYDNIDLDYTKNRGIVSTNVKAYSTASVAQHTISMALYLLEKLKFYDEYVKSGAYAGQTAFSHFSETYQELSGKTWGIVGLGNIGRAVAKIAEAFGCRVIFYSVSGHTQESPYQQVDMEMLLRESDMISIHCPLTENSRNLFGKAEFEKMKKSAYIVNVARGPIVNEFELYDALIANEIAGAALDVLKEEPMKSTHPLLQIQDSKKLFITPHMAWASIESRTRCMQEIGENIEAFLDGRERNRL